VEERVDARLGRESSVQFRESLRLAASGDVEIQPDELAVSRAREDREVDGDLLAADPA
jgi:hypothetical protein